VDATEPASNTREGTPTPVTQPRDDGGLNSTPFSRGTSANSKTMQPTKCVVSNVRTEQHALMVVLKVSEKLQEADQDAGRLTMPNDAQSAYSKMIKP
jgi:hypothetical protein